MKTLAITGNKFKEVQLRLEKIVAELAPGEEVMVTFDPDAFGCCLGTSVALTLARIKAVEEQGSYDGTKIMATPEGVGQMKIHCYIG